MNDKIISSVVKNTIKNLYEEINAKKDFIKGKSKVSLIEPSFNHEEILEALESMISTNVAMGKKVKLFQNQFAKYCNVNYATMTNSGSSANLVGISALTNPEYKNRIKKNSEVITPAVTWSTTIFPLVHGNLKPKLLDIDIETFCIDSDQISDAITKDTGLILPVHLLGNVCDMDKITEITNKKEIPLMEDCCEAHGAKFKNKSVGTFGEIGTFSFFLSHHITTIEGGMLITNDYELDELFKVTRAFGWTRDLKEREKINENNPSIDPRFLFVNMGFNLRPTEIQGGFGLKQLPKLNNFIKIRTDNFNFWTKSLNQYDEFFILPKKQKNVKQVHFCYPLTIKNSAPFTRKELTDYLEKNLIETRPIMAGNIAEQPAMKLIKYSKEGELPNSKLAMRNSFFFGNHHGIGKVEREFVVDTIAQFIERKIWKK
jgi:CDP-6-deoxy-D-xylo-4-hexulose-3-dehydrase